MEPSPPMISLTTVSLAAWRSCGSCLAGGDVPAQAPLASSPRPRVDGVAVAERLGTGSVDRVGVGHLAAGAGDVVEHGRVVDGEVEGGAVAALDHLDHGQLRLALVGDRAGLLVAGGEGAQRSRARVVSQTAGSTASPLPSVSVTE